MIKRILSRRHKISSGSTDSDTSYTDCISTYRVPSPLPIRRSSDIKSKSSDNLDANVAEPIKLFHKRNVKRTISADNLAAVMSNSNRPTLPVRRLTFASYGTSPTSSGLASTAAGRQRKIATSAESTPPLLRKASAFTDKTITGHQKVNRMFSCPQLSHNAIPLEKELPNITGLPITGAKAGLPEISQENQAQSDRETCQTGYMSVSPRNSDGSFMDKNLQQRINAFLDSLTVNDYNEDELQTPSQ